MKIAIIGAGFTGLTASYILAKNGHQVEIFEKDPFPGGLAVGYKEPGWSWSLEKHYHHWFTNDKAILSLAREIDYRVISKRPKTSSFIEGNIYQLDSPASLMRFPLLSIWQRIRLGFILGILRLNPFWRPLEGLNAAKTLRKIMGKKTYEMIWEPLLVNKFGSFTENISFTWFWARIKKRTPSLRYPERGFLGFAQHLQKEIEKRGGRLYYNTEVKEIKNQNAKVRITTQNSKTEDREFDKVVVTLPSFLFLKIVRDLPLDYQKKLKSLKSLGAINLVLRLKEPFLKDGTYWLNICDSKSPIMAIVEHTNFMDKKYYNNEHIVYLGNYLPIGHHYMKLTKEELLKIYTPYLKRINPDFESCILNFELFKAPFAQPVIFTNYSEVMPPFETPLDNVYLANMQQVYPWDRGTNYAVELGEKIATLLLRQK
ncbi:NAD(P)/FAD-dependent oxidoreductase [Patescibacteria group bacterium]|nr:NAD(P)/FAD-dependent oxidoreductase [Patescibacteria group bacterium]MCL5010043.1 NAD(P)/FAD-dependent oxidoreductase [Patescibacteria group bacterium]